MWMNKIWIVNLLPITILEEDGYCVTYDMRGEWVVYTPYCAFTVFNIDTGLCNRMPCINMQESQAAVEMGKTLQNNLESYSRNQVEKSILPCKVQAMVGHPTGERFKHTVRSKPWNNSSIKVEDFTNAQTIFGPDLASVQGKTVI